MKKPIKILTEAIDYLTSISNVLNSEFKNAPNMQQGQQYLCTAIEEFKQIKNTYVKEHRKDQNRIREELDNEPTQRQ